MKHTKCAQPLDYNDSGGDKHLRGMRKRSKVLGINEFGFAQDAKMEILRK